MKVSRWVFWMAIAALAFGAPLRAETIRYTYSQEGSEAAAVEAHATSDCNDCGTCDSCTPCCDDGGLTLSLFAPSEPCFDDFISPMTNPVYFEDPRQVSELRIIYLTHKVPLAAGGGRVDLFAAQIRAALNDRLSIIATKDGYAVSSNALINDGWADINLGLKYSLYRDAQTGTMLSAGATYEAPFGSPAALQGNGDGVVNLFASGGTRIGDNGHWLSTGGMLLALDSAAESEFVYWSNHFDRKISNITYAFTEFNWYNYSSSGAGGIAGVEGGDLFNLGSTGVTGNDIVTGAFGLKLKPSRHTEIGAAWEVPLTERRDVLDNRLTFDFILRY